MELAVKGLHRAEMAALVVGAASGSLIFATMPLVVGATIASFGSPSGGGISAGIELLTMGAGSFLVSLKIASLPGRATAVPASLTLILGQLLSVYFLSRGSWEGFLLSRAVSGAGEGALFAICNSFAAKANRPDRLYTIIAFAQVLANCAFFLTIAIVNRTFDPVRIFVIFAIFAIVALPFLLMAPKARLLGSSAEATAAKAPFTPMIISMLVGFGIYSVALFMLFSFAEPLGLRAGLSHQTVSGIFAISTFTALLGPTIMATIGLRFGRLRPVLIAVAMQIASGFIVVFAKDLVPWAGAQILGIMLLYVLSPMMFGLSAHLDPSGRATGVATAIMALTAAIGPIVAGGVLELTSSYAPLAWLNAAAYLLMLGFVLKPLRRSDLDARAASALATG